MTTRTRPADNQTMSPWVALAAAITGFTLAAVGIIIAVRKHRGPHVLPAALVSMGILAGQSLSLAVTAIGRLR